MQPLWLATRLWHSTTAASFPVMACRASLKATNLEALGAPAWRNCCCRTPRAAVARWALRLALAEQRGPLDLAQEVRKLMAAVEESSGTAPLCAV